MDEQPKRTLSEAFQRLADIIELLRAPDGCPWDREQTHDSLQPYLIEEAHEAAEAIDDGNIGALEEELGDLLTLIALHAQIAAEAGQFNLLSLINKNNAKLIRRHAHVFGERKAETAADALNSWERVKRSEPGYENRASALDGVPKSLPALMAAAALQKKAARAGFERHGGSEIRLTLNADDTVEEVQKKIGEALFELASAARLLGVDPEAALRQANAQFQRRFRDVEKMQDDAEREDASFAELWRRAEEGGGNAD